MKNRLIQILRTFRQDDRAVALIEFALITPILLLLLLGITDFGMFQNEKMRLTAAARAGAQYALADDSSEAAIEAVVLASTNFSSEAVTVTINKTFKCSEDDDGDTDPENDTEYDSEDDSDHECEGTRTGYIHITVSEQYETFMNYAWLDNPYTLVGEVVMRIN